jgi:carbamoyl-phosphate synthase large subunit
MNVLITSIGQRGYLIDHFRESCGGRFGIYAADATEYAPGLRNADKAFLLPRATDPQYGEALKRICRTEGIKGVVSINDLELPVLARLKADLRREGIVCVVSDPGVVDMCFDKYLTYQFCLRNQIPVPRTYRWHEVDELIDDVESGVLSFPVIAKPRKGSRSVGIYLVHDMEQLEKDAARVGNLPLPEDEKVIYQEYIDSDQFSLHIFNDAALKPVCVVSMVNIFRHFGETFHIRTFRDSELIELGILIGEKVKHLGPLSVDVHRRDNGEYVVLEFNPRISGCYSLSHYAGADFPGKIFDIVLGQQSRVAAIDAFEDDVIMLKQYVTAKVYQREIDEYVCRSR